MTLLLLSLMACTDDETHVCDDATLTLEDITADPKGSAGTSGIACGAVYEARDDGIDNSCGDSGLEDPTVRDGVYAIWPSDWGLERRGYSVGVRVLATDGTEVTDLPAVNLGDSLAVQTTVRYDQVYDPCSNSLFASAYLEIAASELSY